MPYRPTWAAKCITIRTQINLPWRERLEILLGARVELETRVFVEHAPGSVDTLETVHVWWAPRNGPTEKERVKSFLTVGDECQ